MCYQCHSVCINPKLVLTSSCDELCLAALHIFYFIIFSPTESHMHTLKWRPASQIIYKYIFVMSPFHQGFVSMTWKWACFFNLACYKLYEATIILIVILLYCEDHLVVSKARSLDVVKIGIALNVCLILEMSMLYLLYILWTSNKLHNSWNVPW